MTLRVGSLFSGVGGFDMGFLWAGFDVRWQCEVDEPCKGVLAARFPETGRLYDDIRTVNWDAVEPVDVIIGGFPCQDLSVAGRRAGLDGVRSGLFFQFARVIGIVRPALAVIENVPGLLSSDGGRDMAVVLGTLADLGALDVGWRVLDAQYFGVAQRRRRVFLVADFAGERAAEVLALTEGLQGHPAPRRETGKGVAGSLGGGTSSGGWRNDLDANGAFIRREDHDRVAAGLTAGGHPHSNRPGRHREDDVNLVTGAVSAKWSKQSGGPAGDEAYNLVPTLSARHSYDRGDGAEPLVTHALTSEGADASEDGTGRGTPLVVAFDARNDLVSEEQTGTLQSKSNGGYSLNYQPVIALQHTLIGRDKGDPEGPGWRDDDTAFTLDSRRDADAVVYPVRTAQTGSNGWGVNEDETSYTLDGTTGQAVATSIGLGSDPLHAADLAQPVTGRNGDPGAVAFGLTSKGNGEAFLSDTHTALSTGGGQAGQGYPAVAFGVEDDTAYALRANPSHSGDPIDPLPCRGQHRAHAKGQSEGDGGINTTMVAAPLMNPGQGGRTTDVDAPNYIPEVANTLADAGGQRGWSASVDVPNYLPQPMGVRRLTPVECERLMGWPDDHTRYLVTGRELSDSTRYRMCGNGVVAPVARWLAERIKGVLEVDA